MKRKTLQIVVAFLLGLSLLVVWGAEADISRASGDSNLTLSPVKTVANTSLEVNSYKTVVNRSYLVISILNFAPVESQKI